MNAENLNDFFKNLAESDIFPVAVLITFIILIVIIYILIKSLIEKKTGIDQKDSNDVKYG